MKLRVDGVERMGPAIDARQFDVDGPRIRRAIDDPRDDLVRCPRPGPLHERLGVLHPDATHSRRRLLAAVARSRGVRSRLDAEIAALHAEIGAIDPPRVDVTGAVSAVRDAEREVAGLRDDVARLGGVAAGAADPTSADSTRTELRETAGRLADAETTLLAARQELARQRERQRAANDARTRRLRLRDQLENREREARSELASTQTSRVARALDALPDWRGASEDAMLALAAARIAPIRAPLVVDAGPFRTALQARATLDAPVVLV